MRILEIDSINVTIAKEYNGRCGLVNKIVSSKLMK